jgi:flagellar protein FliO/FliZ
LKIPNRWRLTLRRRVACALAVLLCGATELVCAASSAPFAAPEQVASSSSTSGLLRVVVALLIVLAAVLAAARFTKRVRGFSGGANAGLEVLGQLPLGARERAVLIRVGERQLLIGVAPGNVRTLHVFDEPLLPRDLTASDQTADQAVGGANARPSFKSLLLKSLGK